MILTRRQALGYVGRAERTLAQWLAEGLPYVQQPGVRGRLFSTDDLDEFARKMNARNRTGKGRPKGSKNRSTGATR